MYVDAILSQIMAPNISKMLFHRFESSPTEINTYVKRPVIELVMPANHFADLVAFLEHRLRLMVKNGYVSQGTVDERRKLYSTFPEQ